MLGYGKSKDAYGYSGSCEVIPGPIGGYSVGYVTGEFGLVKAMEEDLYGSADCE
ncbi:MAG TPA: hypothetical protein VFA44_08500 [Gaiellaceae bacterium]|nr:hypothetical protein [Gaiellaceae bacterium]